MPLVLPAFLCLASGFLLVSLCWPRRAFFPDDILRVSLSAGFGLGLFSVVFFVCRAGNVTNLALVDWAVLGSLSAGFAARSRVSSAKPAAAVTRDELSPAWFQRVLMAAFAVALFAAIYSALMRLRAFPCGDGWDAFAIWNFHARFLFRGGANWRDGFSSLAGGTQSDYPLLLPAAIAHAWTYLGRDDPGVPAVIGIVFTLATAGVLFAALALLRGRVQAMMGSIVLLSTPSFIEQGTAQYADVPLGFFFLVTVVLLCLFDGGPDAASESRSPALIMLAGLAAGFAAWTKNEGLLFLAAIFVSRMWFLVPSSNDIQQNRQWTYWTAATPLLAGLLPGLLITAYFKHTVAAPSGLLSDPRTALHKLFDPSRYWTVAAGYLKGLFRFGHWLCVPGTLLLVGLYVAAGKGDRRTHQPGFRSSVVALALTLAGYFVVFLVTPYEIHWHLRFSLVRLFLQVWPSAVFLFFLAVKDASTRQGET